MTSFAAAEPSHLDVDTITEFSAYTDTDAVTVYTPALRGSVKDPLAGWSASGTYLVDIVSAASVDIVSAASPRWMEVRHAGTLSGSYKPKELGVSAFGAVSSEPDYLALSGGGSASIDLLKKNLTLLAAYSYGHDVAGRSGTPFSVYSLTLNRHTVSTSAAIVLSRSTLLTLVGDAVLESGRQEKPYRWLPLFDAGVAPTITPGASVDEVNALRLPGRITERVPDTRQRFALTGRFAHRGRASTWLAESRLYADSWGLVASTEDVRWIHDVSRRLSLWPHLRLNVQRGATFWKLAYVGDLSSGRVDAPEFRSGDRELSPLWSGTFGGGGRFDFGNPQERAFGLILQLEATYTDYLRALYIGHRWAGLAVLQAEVKL